VSPQRRWFLITVVTFAGMVITAGLGRWQLQRADEKEVLQASIDAREQEPVLDAASVGRELVPDYLHRRVVARGRWLPERTVYLDNRQMFGRPGFFVVTPLQIPSTGAVVLVQRGWVPRDFEDRQKVPAIETPAGDVLIQGRLAMPPSKLYDLGGEERGPIRQNLDLRQFRLETGLALSEMSVQQTGPASEGLAREWPPINTGVSKHYGYAFQWFGLCALMAILYGWFQLVPRLRSRQR
jgi:surfeit locus 1 family protein